MKKGLVAALMAVLLSCVFALPAFAAELSDNEKGPYNEFVEVVERYRPIIGDSHANQYEAEAKSALLKVDLSADACKEFSQVVKDCAAVLDNAKPANKAEAWKHVDELLSIINPVAKKYDMWVTVDANTHYATVYVNGSVVSAPSGVKQTGFALSQTLVVLAAAATVLGGAFFVARKNQLFA